MNRGAISSSARKLFSERAPKFLVFSARICSVYAVHGQKLSIRGLAGNFAIWTAGFVLISELALVGWLKAWNQERSLQSLQDLALSNASFISEMRLPSSEVLARRLSTVLDLDAGFYSNDKPGQWSAGLEKVVARLAAEEGVAAGRSAGFEVATAPLVADSPERLVLIRPVPGFGVGVLIPMLGLAVVCGGLGIVLGRGMVRPLGVLTRWLPNLDLEGSGSPTPIPETLMKRKDEIGTLARALDQTAQRLGEEQRLRRQSERMATLGRIATSLAHEIKNPAAAIGLHADVLQGEVAAQHRGSIAMIREEVERITDLVHQWLYVARSRPGKRDRHDLGDLMKAVGRRMAPVFDHAKVRLEMETAPGAFVHADAPRIEQALRNLLLNAVQAMPEGGTVRVALRARREWIEVVIEDEGPGFSPEAMRRFGEPFFSEREGGMGIGLTLAIEVMEAHGGSILPQNLPDGCGARLLCRLPAPESKQR